MLLRLLKFLSVLPSFVWGRERECGNESDNNTKRTIRDLYADKCSQGCQLFILKYYYEWEAFKKYQ